MRVFLTGGTGLIGRSLVRRLLDRGDQPVILTRRADQARLKPSLKGVEVVQGDPTAPGPWDAALDGCDAVINLVGHNLFAERWDAEVKRKIRDSRVFATDNVVSSIARASSRPKVLVQASAIGFYGPHADEELTEEAPAGDDFLARICREWEDAARPAESLGLRLATVRTGVVLAKGEGALGVMTPIVKWLPGGAAPVGNGGHPVRPAKGQQWMSWIQLDDIVGIFLLALDHPDARGPINGTAPNPVRNAEFMRALAKVFWKPWAFWRIYLPFGPPDPLLKQILGEVADIVTHGQRVLPAKARSLGYTFHYPELLPALRADPRPDPIPLRAAEPRARSEASWRGERLNESIGFATYLGFAPGAGLSRIDLHISTFDSPIPPKRRPAGRCESRRDSREFGP